jgi:Flp pilus assembly protein TadB
VFGIPPLPEDLAEGEAEVRRLVDAGASSPEELRALAERLREQRAAEEEAWRREVRPALMQSKKARGAFVGARSSERETRSIGPAVMVLVGIVLLLLIAAQTTALVLLLPVVGVLVYAYQQGRGS